MAPAIIAGVLALAILLFLFTKSRVSPGMIPAGGPRIKNWLAWLMIRSGSRRPENAVDPSHANRKIPPLPGKEDPDYNDSFVFQGSDAAGNLFMSRIGIRGDGSVSEVWLWIVLEGKKYVITKAAAPTDPGPGDTVSAGGLAFYCPDESAGAWEITFSGPLDPGVKRATVRLAYVPRSALYHSGVHMNAMTFARAMAEMPWSRRYFDNLRSENQCRIEQGGALAGRLSLDGRDHEISMLSIRDHSWGKRNWTFINRYIWNIVSFEDDVTVRGMPYRYMVYTTVDYGTTFRHLAGGWMAGENMVLPIVQGDDMGLIGEDGRIPAQYTYRFRHRGGKIMELSVDRSAAEHSWFTQENRFEVCESYCSVSCNGVRGHGMSEFGYSAMKPYGRKFPA